MSRLNGLGEAREMVFRHDVETIGDWVAAALKLITDDLISDAVFWGKAGAA